MPSLSFYAYGDDHGVVLDAVFDLGIFRVFEYISRPDSEVQEFAAPDEVPVDPYGSRHLFLYPIGSGPEPATRRINLHPGALGDATFRYEREGWGLIRLMLSSLNGPNVLQWSSTAHNSEKRATKWAESVPHLGIRLGDPTAWDWPAVTRASSRLNRVIQKRAVRKIGTYPVLPQAGQIITQNGLQYHRGPGIHSSQYPTK